MVVGGTQGTSVHAGRIAWLWEGFRIPLCMLGESQGHRKGLGMAMNAGKIPESWEGLRAPLYMLGEPRLVCVAGAPEVPSSFPFGKSVFLTVRALLHCPPINARRVQLTRSLFPLSGSAPPLLSL